MAVSKRQSDDRITEALSLGLRLFGESLVQETRDRIHLFPTDSRVHLIGHLQRNKARDAARLYQAIQSIDSQQTINALAPHLGTTDQKLEVYIEVNSSGEESKYGVRDSDELLRLVDQVRSAEHLALRGLMTIGPLTDSEPQIRRSFSLVREYRDRILQLNPDIGDLGLSMGMSDDLEYAILEGSSMVRVGTAIFGPRTR